MCPPLKHIDSCEMLTDQESPDSSGNEKMKDVKNQAPAADTNDDHQACISEGSSPKQHRKMLSEKLQDDPINFSYTWTQTETDVAVTVTVQGLSDELTRAFDVSFTSKEVNIKSADNTKVIYFYDDIQKEESRVQATKGSIIIRVVKQRPGWWNQLESNKEEKSKNVQDEENINSQVSCETKMESSSEDTKPDLSVSIKEKEDEPVYRLNHMKHDYYERDQNFTLRVFTKSLNKDAVKVNFSQKGFVLKFQTSDTRFLQLYEGTTSETAFTWPVITKQEILAEECKFTVKSTVIEIILKKVTAERWATLEATQRKEKSESAQSDTWIPISAKASAVPPTSSTASCSGMSSRKSMSDESNKQQIASERSSGGVAFDDLSEINVNVKSSNQRMAPTSLFNRQQQEENEEGPSGFSFDNSQKPMAKVSPLNNQMAESGMVVAPGFSGLMNIGNTCFMNCIIQVLANTREFRDFFLDKRYLDDINEDNPLGMRGQLAATFGTLLRWLWSCKRHYWDPRKLKDLVSKKNPQFFGYAQHDAHEFLAFLLDGLHEDLNRIRKKPYTETIDSDGRPDSVVADEAWAQYKLRNDSVVVDLFQGQFKSKLVCPRCEKVSITFDPFLYMSVPLPKKKRVIPVKFMWKESYKKPIKYLIQIAQDSTIEKLKEELSKRTRVRPCDIRVFEAYRGRILKFFLSGASLSNIEPKDVIIASEILSEDVAGEDVLEIPVMQRTLSPAEYPSHCAFCRKTCLDGSPLKRCTKCYKVGYCDQTCQRNHWNSHKNVCSTLPDPIGCPFIMSVPASRATYSYMVKHMEEFARFSVDVFRPPVKSNSSSTSASSSSTTAPEIPAPTIIKTHPAAGAGAPSSSLSSTSVLAGAGPGVLGPATNLSSCSLSQSSSSLNSLDSLSSASSTCTLTGDTSDTAIGGGRAADVADGAEEGAASFESNASSRYASPCPPQLLSQVGYESVGGVSAADVQSSGSVDSGFESVGTKSANEKAVPVTSVLGVQAAEVARDRATPIFFIKPVTMEGVGLKGSDRLEDKGETPLQLTSGAFLSMDWRNNERLESYVLVQSKDLECNEADNMNYFAPSIAAARNPTLYNCLEMFTEPEVLSPEEAWYCPRCKKHVEAIKQMSIWRLPHTLVIQLKRFSFQHFLLRSKIKKHIDFPTRGLDLSNFCVGLQPGESPPIYDLYGVANHHGMLIGGHYTSYVRCSGLGRDVGAGDEIGWRLCNDSRVTAVDSESSVVTSDAYLLFYRRRCPAIIGPSVCPAVKEAAPRGLKVASSSAASYVEKLVSLNQSSYSNGCELDKDKAEDDKEDDDDDGDDDSQGLSSRTRHALVDHRIGTPSDIDFDLGQFRGAGDSTTHDLGANANLAFKRPSHQHQKSSTMQSAAAGFASPGARERNDPEDVGEKRDKEKEFDDCDRGRIGHHEVELYDEDDDDTDDYERNLVIASEPDLGYTDMEAVD